MSDTAAFAALLNELRGPLTGVAATLSKSNQGGMGAKAFGEDDLHKLNFRELADRFEHLSQVLPDALRCVQEVKQIQQSVQERLDILEGRQQSEEAYLSSLQELQEAIMSQGGTLQDDIKERMAQLRQVLNDREAYLLNKVHEVERDKLSVVERQREQCLGVLENMRSASRRAHQALADEDPTTWLDQGKGIEELLAEQNAVKVEYGPSPDLRFGCTLTVDLQRRILEVVDFDENKGPGSPAKGGVSYKPSPFTSSALNQSGTSINEMVLPDGTDYATFRRSLLAEGGVDAAALFRSSTGAGGRSYAGAAPGAASYSRTPGSGQPGRPGAMM